MAHRPHHAPKKNQPGDARLSFWFLRTGCPEAPDGHVRHPRRRTRPHPARRGPRRPPPDFQTSPPRRRRGIFPQKTRSVVLLRTQNPTRRIAPGYALHRTPPRTRPRNPANPRRYLRRHGGLQPRRLLFDSRDARLARSATPRPNKPGSRNPAIRGPRRRSLRRTRRKTKENRGLSRKVDRRYSGGRN